MKNITYKRIGVGILAFIIVVLGLFMIISLLIQRPVSAAYTFPDIYDLVTVNNTNGKGVDRDAVVKGVSGDGNKVLFVTTATNLPQATSNVQQRGAYLRDLTASATIRVDTSSSGIAASSTGEDFSLSTTGRYVAFTSSATNLIDGQVLDNSIGRLYFKDLQTNAVELLTNINGPSTNQDNQLRPISISDDGRYIFLQTANINRIIPGARPGSPFVIDSLVYDRHLNDWKVLGVNTSGLLPDEATRITGVSCDGSFIIFSSSQNDLVLDYSGSGKHVYLVDVRNGYRTTDITAGAQGVNESSRISCNGRYVTYNTTDRTLIAPTPGNMNTTSSQGVLYDRFTDSRKYVGSLSNGTTFSSYYSDARDVSDNGDVLLLRKDGSQDPYDVKLYLKHLSDGSGTLEAATHNGGGLNSYLNSYRMASNGKYIVSSVQNAYDLGLNVNAGRPPSAVRDIIRIHTGL